MLPFVFFTDLKILLMVLAFLYKSYRRQEGFDLLSVLFLILDPTAIAFLLKYDRSIGLYSMRSPVAFALFLCFSNSLICRLGRYLPTGFMNRRVLRADELFTSNGSG